MLRGVHSSCSRIFVAHDQLLVFVGRRLEDGYYQLHSSYIARRMDYTVAILPEHGYYQLHSSYIARLL